jgi:hypothetical protein
MCYIEIECTPPELRESAHKKLSATFKTKNWIISPKAGEEMYRI